MSAEGLGEGASTLGRPSDGKGDWVDTLSRGSGRVL